MDGRACWGQRDLHCKSRGHEAMWGVGTPSRAFLGLEWEPDKTGAMEEGRDRLYTKRGAESLEDEGQLGGCGAVSSNPGERRPREPVLPLHWKGNTAGGSEEPGPRLWAACTPLRVWKGKEGHREHFPVGSAPPGAPGQEHLPDLAAVCLPHYCPLGPKG